MIGFSLISRFFRLKAAGGFKTKILKMVLQRGWLVDTINIFGFMCHYIILTSAIKYGRQSIELCKKLAGY